MNTALILAAVSYINPIAKYPFLISPSVIPNERFLAIFFLSSIIKSDSVNIRINWWRG